VIIARTPFRVSFLGGGTDLPEFWQEEEGAVLSTAIDKYMHITVNNRFDKSWRLGYSKTEICEDISKIDHKIFRRVLEKYSKLALEKNHGCGLEILSMADIPSGTGLGSSSSFTVSLLHALKGHLGIYQSAEELAREASEIEIKDLKEPIGKQDQYAAAYGGLRYIRFLPSGEVSAEPVICTEDTKRSLEGHMAIFYTGVTRSASGVLSEQKSNTESKRETLRAMKDLAFRMKVCLEKNEPIRRCGELLDEGWKLKKTLASGISAGPIDQWYDRAVSAGAYGGKILGAGGGGFLMVLCPPDKRSQIASELKELRQVEMKFDNFGSRIVFVG
jgi:D-glycero-alpha-D-manno-heptose-7-phosphate kinase